MDALLSLPLFVGFAFATVVAFVLLRKTWLFWLPGVGAIAYGVAIYIAWPWYDTHEDVALLEGASNTLHVVVSFGVVAGGIVCVLLGARSRKMEKYGSSGRPVARRHLSQP